MFWINDPMQDLIWMKAGPTLECVVDGCSNDPDLMQSLNSFNLFTGLFVSQEPHHLQVSSPRQNPLILESEKPLVISHSRERAQAVGKSW